MENDRDQHISPEEGALNSQHQEAGPEGDHTPGTVVSREIVRIRKTIIFHENEKAQIDQTIIQPNYYTAFDCSLLPSEALEEKFILGVTSPNPSDGKTLVAANLAVSLAMSLSKEIVLVDFSLRRPRLHKIFDIEPGPGALEALNDVNIHVTRTAINHVSLLQSGNLLHRPLESAKLKFEDSSELQPLVRLEHLGDFRNLMYSLKQEFDMVIVDLPSIRDSGLASLFAKQLDGILVVVHAGKTKRRELDQVMFHLHAANVVGFVFNRATQESVTV